MPNRVAVFDTTLRDGEQSAGVLFSERDKLDIAEQLASMRVDVIEAGFPAASPTEWRSVHAVAGHIKNASVCALARCVPGDVDASALLDVMHHDKKSVGGLTFVLPGTAGLEAVHDPDPRALDVAFAAVGVRS